MANAKPRFLPIARVDGHLDVAGIQHVTDSAEAALRAALDDIDSSISYVHDSTDRSVRQYEVYVSGRGNEVSPQVFTPDDVAAWMEDGRGPLAP